MDDCGRCWVAILGIILLGGGTLMTRFGYNLTNSNFETPCTSQQSDQRARILQVYDEDEPEMQAESSVPERSKEKQIKEEELQDLEAEKKRAVEDEDYLRASKLKEQIKAIEEGDSDLQEVEEKPKPAPEFMCDRSCIAELSGWNCEDAKKFSSEQLSQSGVVSTCACFFSLCGGCSNKTSQGHEVACKLAADGICRMDEAYVVKEEHFFGRIVFWSGIALTLTGLCCCCCMICDVPFGGDANKRPRWRPRSEAPEEGSGPDCRRGWLVCGKYVASACAPSSKPNPPRPVYAQSTLQSTGHPSYPTGHPLE